jgi:membrane-associated protease RseP (regulator of RpoE activity)
MHRFLLSSLLVASVCAVEPAPAIKPAEPPPTGTTPAPKPFLGVRFDENSVALDSEPGMPINEIVSGSTVQVLGLESGDRLVTLNGKPTEKTTDIERILGGSKVGDQVTVEYVRAGKKTLVQGPMLERPKPAALAREVDKLNQKLLEVKELAESKSREPSLGEILQQLKDIEMGLPRAVAAFKRQYPDGEFDISITVKIVSDKKAKDPLEFSNAQAVPEPLKPTEKSPEKTGEKTAEKTAGKPTEITPPANAATPGSKPVDPAPVPTSPKK